MSENRLAKARNQLLSGGVIYILAKLGIFLVPAIL